MPVDDLENLRRRVKQKHQWDEDDEPIAQITICRFPTHCGEGPCDNCFKFFEDDPRSTEQLEACMKNN